MDGRTGRLIGAGLLAAAGIALGGCQNVPKTQYEMVIQENQELRDRLATEQTTRQELETRNASLEQENRDLAGRTAAKPGSTGFEGSGWDSYRTAGGEVVVSALGDVLFDSGRTTLKPSAKTSLNQIASVIRSQYAGKVVRVEGYSDTDPIKKSGWKTNERLSGERAMAVEEYLVSQGLSQDQIYYAGFGAARQRESKAKSRRVEIVILASGR